MNHTEVIERTAIINRASFRLDTGNPEIGDEGTVEVNINGETRIEPCGIGGEDVIHACLKGRYGDDPRWWTVRVDSQEDGTEYYVADEAFAPKHLAGAVPTEIRFMAREHARVLAPGSV